MTTPERSTLDTAIDQVARRLVAVPDDAALTARIVASLPERSSRWWRVMPQLAALGAIVLAVAVWATRDRLVAPEVEPLAARMEAPIAVPPTVIARNPEPARTLPVERVEHLEPLERPASQADFERSLPPVAAPGVLALSELPPIDLPATPALSLEPIDVAALPLSAESFSPRE